MSDSVLDISDLRVGYGDRIVLDGIDLRVEREEIAVILGESGCGKSTLLKSIVGLIEPCGGRVELLGHNWADLSEREREELLRRIGVLFQHGALLNSLTVGDNVALPLEMHADLPPSLVEEIVRTRLDMVGLGHTYDLFPDELSGGMRKRAALARAMVLEPEILFCDEPGAGLDPVTAAEIDRLLLTLNQRLGTTLVVVTHELLSIERLNGRLIMLAQGKVRFTGRTREARETDDPVVHRFFHPGGTE